MGMSPQSGVPHNNRIGDFDPFALPVLMRATGQHTRTGAGRPGLSLRPAGLERHSGDVRDLEGPPRQAMPGPAWPWTCSSAKSAAILGGLLVELGGLDALVFTGGIGENSAAVRAAVCAESERIRHSCSTPPTNTQPRRANVASAIRTARVAIWIVPTNEELIVARQTRQLLEG